MNVRQRINLTFSRNLSTYPAYGTRFQIRTGPSSAPLTNCLLSGVNAMDVTPLLCPRNISVELRVSRLQSLIVSALATNATWFVFFTGQIRDRVLLESQEAKQEAKRERQAVVVPVEHSVESQPAGGDQSASRPLAQRGLAPFRQTRRQAK